MGRARVGSLRTIFYWPGIQPTRQSAFDWSSTDDVMREAANQKIDVLPVISDTPSFQAPGCTQPGCGQKIRVATPAQRAELARFLRAAALRYGSGGSFWKARPGLRPDPIRHWEIWNEENNPAQGNPPSTYAKLLSIANHALKAADPHAQIVVGGMFGTPKGGPSATAWSYLRRLYATGAKPYFDAVALHPYAPNLAGIRYQLGKIRAVQEDNDDASTPVLITELGWGSGGGQASEPGTGGRGQVFVVSPQRQRRNLTQSFSLLTDNRGTWNLGGVYWFSWKDPALPPAGLCAFCYSSGLYEADGTTAKPALPAFERFTKATAGPP